MTDPEEFQDINGMVGEDWKAETTPYERIREVISHAYAPIPADTVAENAWTSPKTARKHLKGLAAEGFVATETGENGGTHYRRSPESLVVEQAADILTHVSVDELRERVSEMRERINEFQTEYGVESPAELAVDQTNRILSGESLDHEELDANVSQEWQTTRRNLAFANAALSIANAERFVDEGSRSPDGDLTVQ